MDLTFTTRLQRRAKFIGLCPWYHDTNKTSFNYAYLVLLIELLLMVTMVYLWIKAIIKPGTPTTYYIFPICELLTLIVFVVAYNCAAIRLGSHWNALLENCREIDYTLSSKGLEVGTIKTHILAMFLFNTIYAITFALGFFERRNVIEKFPLFYTLLYMYYTYRKLTVTVITNLLTSIIENRYKFLAMLLKRSFHSSREDVKHTVKEVGRLMEILKDCADFVNVITGGTSFALILHSFAAILASYEDLRSFWEHPVIFSSISKATFAYSSQRIFICILSFTIISGCDKVESAHYEILNVCNEFRTHLMHFTLRDDLIKFYKYAKVLSPKFTAVGFFRLDRKLFLSFLSILITYLIFVGQLYSSWYDISNEA